MTSPQHNAEASGAGDIAEALWYTAPGQAAWQREDLPPVTRDAVRIATHYSAISRGTEALVSAGRVPPGEYRSMRAPYQGGEFPFPVKYGYAAVGRVVAGGGDLAGRLVFALHPHQTAFVLPAAALLPLPDGVSPRRALLAANMETALNAAWDGGAGPAQTVAIVGAGVVGLLLGWLLARLPGAKVTLVDVNPAREGIARLFNCAFAGPDAAPTDCDLVFHCSASAAGLATAIGCAGDEASVVELSWFGAGEVAVPLGGAFHRRRLKLVSSQVGRVAPSQRSRWDYRRRLTAALTLLSDPVLDALLEAPCPYLSLPARLPAIFDPRSGILCQPIAYPAATS